MKTVSKLRKNFLKIKNGFLNLLKYYDVIWNVTDRNSRNEFYVILKMILLVRMREIAKNDYYESTERTIETIKTFLRLLDKVQNEFYDEEYYNYQKVDLGFEKTSDNICQMKTDILWEDYDTYFKLHPRIYKQLSQDKDVLTSEDKHYIAIKMGYINQERAEKLLFKFLNDNINNWF